MSGHQIHFYRTQNCPHCILFSRNVWQEIVRKFGKDRCFECFVDGNDKHVKANFSKLKLTTQTSGVPQTVRINEKGDVLNYVVGNNDTALRLVSTTMY